MSREDIMQQYEQQFEAPEGGGDEEQPDEERPDEAAATDQDTSQNAPAENELPPQGEAGGDTGGSFKYKSHEEAEQGVAAAETKMHEATTENATLRQGQEERDRQIADLQARLEPPKEVPEEQFQLPTEDDFLTDSAAAVQRMIEQDRKVQGDQIKEAVAEAIKADREQSRQQQEIQSHYGKLETKFLDENKDMADPVSYQRMVDHVRQMSGSGVTPEEVLAEAAKKTRSEMADLKKRYIDEHEKAAADLATGGIEEKRLNGKELKPQPVEEETDTNEDYFEKRKKEQHRRQGFGV